MDAHRRAGYFRLAQRLMESVIAQAERVAHYIDRLNDYIGHAISWLALAMAFVQAMIIGALFLFNLGALWLQESILYMNGTLFMLALGWTLKDGGHVRVDIFYHAMEPRQKAYIDLAGITLFLLPICSVILISSLPYALASWSHWEGSPETGGIQAVFLLKTIIPVSAVLLGLQGISMAVRSARVLVGATK